MHRFIDCCTDTTTNSNLGSLFNKKETYRCNYNIKTFSIQNRRIACRKLKNGLEDITLFFEDAAKTMVGKGYFYGAEKSFHQQIRVINYITDVVYDAPLSSLHKEVMLPMFTSYSSSYSSIPHLLNLTSQLLLLRCFTTEAEMWKAAYPEQAKKHSFPYTRSSIMKQCYHDLTRAPFVSSEISGGAQTIENLLIKLKNILLNENKKFLKNLSRLPSPTEMKNRNNGKKSQEILVGDQAQAALDIVRDDQMKTIICKIVDKPIIQFTADVNLYEKNTGHPPPKKNVSSSSGGRNLVKKKNSVLNLLSSVTSSSSTSATAASKTVAPSSPKKSLTLMAKKLSFSWSSKTKRDTVSSMKSPRTPSMVQEESKRHEMALAQARNMLMNDMITPDEYKELVSCHQKYISHVDSNGRPRVNTATAATTKTSSNDDGDVVDIMSLNDFVASSPSSSDKKSANNGEQKTSTASSPRSKKKKKRDPKKKTIAEKKWLSHSLATHFASFDDLHEVTRSAWVEAMEKTFVEAGTKVMEQGDKNGNYM